MNDGHDPIEDRIDDGFDRLRSDALALDAMAPLRGLRERRGGLPWTRIALGGGLVAAVLVLAGVFAFGGDDEPEEIVAGPGGEERTATVGIEDRVVPADLTVDDLVGITWVLIEGVGPEGEITIVPGYEPTFEIGPDGFGGNLSCNAYGYRGSFTPVGDRTAEISVSGGFSKAAGCLTDGVMDSEERFTAALTDVVLAELQDGFLVLSSSTSELIFRRGPPESDRVEVPLTDTVTDLDDRVAGQLPPGLDNTRWVLIDGGSEVPLLEQWRPMGLWFDDGRFVAAGYCTGISGEPGGSRVFDNATTGQVDFSRACPDDVVDIDAAFLAAMRTVTDGRLEGGNLVLAAAAGDLVFGPEPAIDIDAFTGVRWDLEAWDLSLDGTGKEPLAPAWFEMRPAANPEADQSSGTMRGMTGCLEFSGRWILVDNAIAFIEEFDLDSCGEELILTDQDEQLYYSIGTTVVPLFRSDGTVALISTREVEGSLFRRGAPIDMSDAPLEGTTWRLIATGFLTLRGKTFTIEFDGDRYTGQTSCGVVEGTFTLDGQLFDASHDSDDVDLCNSDGFATEDFVRRLANADRLVRQNGQLIISAGDTSMIFEPA